jgi:hypothetical protein
LASYRILFWQEIPSQIVASDDDGEVNLPMPQKFIERIDAMAVARGLAGSDEYLDQWNWSDDEDRDGSAEEVAQALLAEFEAKADW